MKTRKKRSRKISSIYDYNSLYSALQVEAVFNALTNNAAFFERKVRRWFSKNYNTPLIDTYKVSWADILIHYYESALEDRSKNDLYDLAMDNYLPEFADRKEQEDKAFAASLIEEQKRSLEAQQKRKGKTTKVKPKKLNTEQPRKPDKTKDVMNLSFNDDQFKEDIEK